MNKQRVVHVDYQRAAELGKHVHVGDGFAFIRADGLKKLGLGWLAKQAGGAADQVIPLVGDEPIDLLAGARVAPLRAQALRLSSATVDKALYREGADTVRMLVVAPFDAGREVTVRVLLDGNEHSRLPLRLDGGGCGATELVDLPAGSYTAELCDDDGHSYGESRCAFTVATYRLAPLTATLLSRELDGSKLQLRVALATYGVPVEGDVQLELLDAGRRIDKARATSSGGEIAAKLDLSGDGPHTVNLSLRDDPSRTATLPIVGSRVAERTAVLLSGLGREVSAALIPAAGAREVRGLYLSEGATRTSPLSLERVDAAVARLTARVEVRGLRALLLDPTLPRARSGAVDVASAEHPEKGSRRYRLGAKQFGEGRYEEALQTLDQARGEAAERHPFYAYYIACCHARLGRRPQAVAWLRAAIEDGFDDIERWRQDDDLADLSGYAPFDTLLSPAAREVDLPAHIAAGETVEIPVAGPLSLLGLGGFVGDAPWEGWAALIAPSQVSVEVDVPERAQPGETLRVAVVLAGGERQRDAASAYLIVKDARLVSPDTPTNRLAAGIKEQLDASSSLLARPGDVETTVTDLVPEVLPPPMVPMMPSPRMVPGGASRAMPMAASVPMQAFGGAPDLEMDGAMMVMESAAGFADEPSEDGGKGGQGGDGAGADADGEALAEAPEVLFADLVALDADGRAELSLELPDAFTDYVVEAFAVAGLDWRAVEGRFRAAKDPFVALQVAPFVQAGDGAVGTLHVGASAGPADVTLTRDGEPVTLASGDMPFEAGHVEGGRAALSFLAGPGEYVALVRDAEGNEDRAQLRVDEPGKLLHRAQTLRLLEPGHSVSLTPEGQGDDRVIALRVLPALDQPFKALVHATADYGHACCEQTAAKMLAAVALYTLDPDARKRAEAIILAGAKREEKMYLPGRGFRMYPESSAEPNDYWGKLAAQYLHYMALLRDLSPSRALTRAVERCVEMAEDACKAYRLDWPPKKPDTMQRAYAAARFGDSAKATARALQMALGYTKGGDDGAVQQRADQAYAAAVLSRVDSRSHLGKVLELANEVVSAFSEGGGLYSTYDSVAAIAMMSELSVAGVVTGAGAGSARVEIDGRELALSEAIALGEGCGERVTCRSGVAAVQVTRVIAEDWGRFASSAPLRVSLARDGKVGSTFSPGDLLELVVQLEKGYGDGDLLWICLPDALTSVEGGGQIKRRSVDFRGRDELRVPLSATALTVSADGESAPQRYAVCVRNMFDEERAGNPGPLEVMVVPGSGGGGGGLLSRARALLDKLRG